MHKSNGGYEFWDSQKPFITDLYENKNMSGGEISRLYHCDPSTILKHLKRWNVEIRRSRYNSKYKINENYFSEIDTEGKAYFVGLLLADGHLSKQGTLMLTMKDRDVVQKFRDALDSDAPIKIDKHGNYAFNIKCKTIELSLKKIGFHNRKSYYLDFKKVLSFIPDNLLHHFVRGLFDGDGSIKIYKYDYAKSPQLHFGFTGLYLVVEFIKTYLNIHTKTVKEGDCTYTCVSSCKQTIKNIYSILYRDATIYMDRKYVEFKKAIEI